MYVRTCGIVNHGSRTEPWYFLEEVCGGGVLASTEQRREMKGSGRRSAE